MVTLVHVFNICFKQYHPKFHNESLSFNKLEILKFHLYRSPAIRNKILHTTRNIIIAFSLNYTKTKTECQLKNKQE